MGGTHKTTGKTRKGKLSPRRDFLVSQLGRAAREEPANPCPPEDSTLFTASCTQTLDSAWSSNQGTSGLKGTAGSLPALSQ